MATWYKPVSFGKRELQMRKMPPPDWPLVYLVLTDNVGRPSSLWTVPAIRGQMGLGFKESRASYEDQSRGQCSSIASLASASGPASRLWFWVLPCLPWMMGYKLRAKINSLHPQAGFHHDMRFNTAVETLRHQAEQTCFKIEYLFVILFKMKFGKVTTPSAFTNFPILLYLMTTNIRNFSKCKLREMCWGTCVRHPSFSPPASERHVEGTGELSPHYNYNTAQTKKQGP